MRRPVAVPLILASVSVLTVSALSACSEANRDEDTLRIVFRKETDSAVTFRDDYIKDVAEKFERKYPGKKVELQPIQAPDQDYYTKVQQLMRSSKTAPDLVYEDTFLLNSDIESGYLRPLDGYLKGWDDWKQFQPNARDAVRGEDGKTYGVPDGTDTRGLWFNKKIFKKAGLPTDWQPKTWSEVLKAARTIKEKVPDVTPFNIFTGKGASEASAMQGLQMLLYGTGEDPLYDEESKKWVTGSEGFRESLEFIETVYDEDLGPGVEKAVDANITTEVATQMLPEGKLGIALDGSWLPQFWSEGGGKPWPGWEKTMGLAAMPTQHGGPPGEVSMSGGWTWSIPRRAHNPDLAWKMIETFQTREMAVDWCVRGAQVAVRKDVAADERYLKSMPGIRFFTERVKKSHYRPALPVYPQVSSAMLDATDSVTTGDASPQEAADTYDDQVEAAVEGAVVEK